MPLELINTIASVLTAVVIASTAIAALVQLRHLRAGNQINAMLAIGNQMDASSFRDALYLVRLKGHDAMADVAFREYDFAFQRRLPLRVVSQEHVQLREALLLVGNTFEELGILVKNRIVDADLFLDRYAFVIALAWSSLAQYIAWMRKLNATDALWENFEYLMVLSQDFASQQGSKYPPGVRRISLPDMWPLPDESEPHAHGKLS